MEHATVKHGRWSVSPLREAGTLLGVLKQSGLAGKGLVDAFDRWSPRLLGYVRADFEALYFKQTGRMLTNDILIQKADKIVRYGGLGPEAEVLRREFMKDKRFKHEVLQVRI